LFRQAEPVIEQVRKAPDRVRGGAIEAGPDRLDGLAWRRGEERRAGDLEQTVLKQNPKAAARAARAERLEPLCLGALDAHAREPLEGRANGGARAFFERHLELGREAGRPKRA